MTVNLSNRDGSETVVRLSMQSVIALSTCFIIAIITGIVIWVYGIQTNLQSVQTEHSVLKQKVDIHKETMQGMAVTLEKMDVKLDVLREDQIRRQRQGK